MTEPDPTRVTSAPALRPAAVVLVLEGIAAFGYGVFEATQINAIRLVVGLGAGLLLVAYGVALVLLARGLVRARRWSRGPVVATQLIQLPLAWNFREGETAWVAVLLALTAIVVLVCVFLPSSTDALIAEDAAVSPPDR